MVISRQWNFRYYRTSGDFFRVSLALFRRVAARRVCLSRFIPCTLGASLHCQARSLFRALDSPGDTGGSLLLKGNNFHKRLRVATHQCVRPYNLEPFQSTAKLDAAMCHPTCIRTSAIFLLLLRTIMPQFYVQPTTANTTNAFYDFTKTKNCQAEGTITR